MGNDSIGIYCRFLFAVSWIYQASSFFYSCYYFFCWFYFSCFKTVLPSVRIPVFDNCCCVNYFGTLLQLSIVPSKQMFITTPSTLMLSKRVLCVIMPYQLILYLKFFIMQRFLIIVFILCLSTQVVNAQSKDELSIRFSSTNKRME